VIGPQGVQKMAMPAQRDLKRAERQQITLLRTPDGI
jgi:hypothetical protein